MRLRTKASAAITSALAVLGMATCALPQSTQPLRPGLTAQQTKEAVEVARGTLSEFRKKTEGANKPEADRREYVIAVEFLPSKEPETKAAPETKDQPTRSAGIEVKNKATPKQPARVSGPLAVVTSYRYFDDITVFATVDLGTRRVVDLQAAQHMRTALSDDEFEEAKALARDRSDPVKALYQRFGEKLSVYPQFSQFSRKDDPRVHRVVHLTYRVGTKDLSYPRPLVDLTTRQVTTPAPEEFSKPRAPR
jgi:hypothetical protein